MEFLFKNLIVWQKAMELAKLVYGLVRQLPAEERYALADQLRRAVASIPSNIAQKSNHHCPPPPLFSTSPTSLTALTEKFTIQHCQMGIMRHRSEHNRYSAAYATGREFGEICQNRFDRECHGKGMNASRQRLRRFGRATGREYAPRWITLSPLLYQARLTLWKQTLWKHL